MPLGGSGFAQISVSGSYSKIVNNFNKGRFSYNRSIDAPFIDRTEGTVDYATPLGGRTENGNILPPYITTYMWKRMS